MGYLFFWKLICMAESFLQEPSYDTVDTDQLDIIATAQKSPLILSSHLTQLQAFWWFPLRGEGAKEKYLHPF